MKYLIISFYFLSNLSFAGSFSIMRGGIDGGGADHYNSSYGSTWFLKGEKKKTNICLKIKEGLSVSEKEVKNSITSI